MGDGVWLKFYREVTPLRGSSIGDIVSCRVGLKPYASMMLHLRCCHILYECNILFIIVSRTLTLKLLKKREWDALLVK